MSLIKAHHPKGLYLLFFSELWERFGFYTVQVLLILYMLRVLHIAESTANYFYGAYNSLLYLTPVIGGFVADRILGYQRAVLWGASFLIVGYFGIAELSGQFFFIGLSCIVVGNGLFKPNISSLVGHLYPQDDLRKDAGFTIFYLGINLGGLLPTLVTGYIIRYYNWNVAFLLAGLGLCLSLTVFVLNRSLLYGIGNIPTKSPLLRNKRKYYILLFLGCISVLVISRILLLIPKLTDISVVIVFFVYVLLILRMMSRRVRHEQSRMIAALILIVLAIGFWSVYNLTYSVLLVFADEVLDKNLFGWNFPTQFSQFFNPFFILVIGPPLSQFWLWTERKSKNPLTPLKFACGISCVAIGFYILAGGTFFSAAKVSVWWLISSYLIQTIGELFLSPIALAMISRLCPLDLTGMMMGFWFMTIAVSYSFAGMLGNWIKTDLSLPLNVLKNSFAHGFFWYGMLATVFAIASFICIPFVKKLIGNSQLS